MVYTYNAHEEGKDTKVLKKKALEHYRASRTVLKAALLVSSEQEKENVADLLDVLDETIAALEKEIKVLYFEL